MSSFLDETVKSMNDDTAPEVTVDETPKPEETVQPTETPAEQVEPKAEPTEEPQPEPEQTQDAPKEEPVEPTEPKPKKDLSGLTKEQKAEFAFKRQLEKQKSKYEQEISKMSEQFASIQQSIDELKNPKPKEQPKTRTDFASDDEYISYLAGESVKGVMAERDADAKKRAEEEAAQKAMEEEEAKRQKEVTDRFTSNCAKAFTDEARYAEFAKRVNKGLSNGLGELLDNVPTVRDYLFENPNGPLVLDKMLTDRDSFVRIMSRASNPIEATIEMHEMAKELLSAPAPAPAPVPQPETPKPIMPTIGKPGKGSSSSAPDVFSSDDALLKYIRGR